MPCLSLSSLSSRLPSQVSHLLQQQLNTVNMDSTITNSLLKLIVKTLIDLNLNLKEKMNLNLNLNLYVNLNLNITLT